MLINEPEKTNGKGHTLGRIEVFLSMELLEENESRVANVDGNTNRNNKIDGLRQNQQDGRCYFKAANNRRGEFRNEDEANQAEDGDAEASKILESKRQDGSVPDRIKNLRQSNE